MYDITSQDTEAISGGNWVSSFARSKIASWVLDQIMSGNVDYASIAEQQGTFYNTVGA